MRSFVAACTALIVLCTAVPGCSTAGRAQVEPAANPADQQAFDVRMAEEQAEGFELLFDGESLDAWTGFQRDDVPAGWSASDGTLAFTPGVDGGDLVTREAYGDFELRLDWRVSEGGNSGIFFRIDPDADRTFESAPEMQVLDDERHRDGQNPLTSAGANYGLHAPTADVVRPAGEWNEVRLIVRNDQVEHWLNGTKVVEYRLWTDVWKSMVAATKFAEWPAYGLSRTGLIGLQDHGDPVWYRNLRIRRL